MRRHVLLLAFLALLALGACRAPEAGAVSTPLLVASNFRHPPFSSRGPGGRPVGIEVEILDVAARELGREVEWIELPFGELLAAVSEGDVDVAAATIGITPEREQSVAFSLPYFETTIVALARIGDGEPKTLDALSGRRVGTDRGTTAVGAAAARVPDAERVLERPGASTWAELLSTGAVDAVVLDRSHAEKFMDDAGTRFHVIAEPLKVERFAVAVHPGADALRAALDAAIAGRD
ncbi:MAG: amino acid ABC transporter substrate-binding protein [bacterium]|nr:amino acid ABC transporter substrate-binding protein [bacterium]